jgi:hypothetical protein
LLQGSRSFFTRMLIVRWAAEEIETGDIRQFKLSLIIRCLLVPRSTARCVLPCLWISGWWFPKFFLSRNTLCSLCRVSRGLHRVFIPVLYRSISPPFEYPISRWGQRFNKISELDRETHLQFTRHLDLGMSNLGDSASPNLSRILLLKLTGLNTCKVV